MRCLDGSCGMASKGQWANGMCWTCWLKLNNFPRYQETQDARTKAATSTRLGSSTSIQSQPPTPPPGLGSLISNALSSVGVTPERVEKLVGAPCGCKERAKKLDQLTDWARRTVKGKIENAKGFLASIFEKKEEDL